MASNADLQITISADAKDLQKEIARAKGALAKFESAAVKGGTGVKKLGAETRGAVPAMTSFSQVVQDSPFGIQGVANNIQQLTANFGSLKKQTGSTASALKELGRGLVTGPLAILTVVSIVTALLVKFGDGLFKTKDKAKLLKEEQEKLTESLKDYEDGLEAVSKARLKGEKSAVKELTTLKLLKAQVENTNLSQDDRNRAYDKLQKLYPSYFGNLDRENTLTGNLKSTYDSLTSSLLKKAKAQAAASLIVENTKKELVLQQQLESKLEDIADLELKKIKQQNIYNDQVKAGVQFSAGAAQSLDDAQGKINTKLDESLSITNQITKLQTDSANLAKQISDNGGILPLGVDGKGGKQIASDISDIGKSLDDLDFESAFDITGLTNLLEESDIAGRLTEATSAASFESFFNRLKEEWKNFTDNDLPGFTESVKVWGEELKETLSLDGFLGDVFSNVGTALGEAISNGTGIVKAVGGELLNALGAFLGKMGEMLIEYGTLAVLKGKLDLAIAAGGPVAIGAGLAAIAVGIALKAAASALGSFAASGGSSGGSTGSSTRSSNFSSGSSNRTSFNTGQRVVFEIAGTKLVGVLSNTLQRDRSLGGSLSITG